MPCYLSCSFASLQTVFCCPFTTISVSPAFRVATNETKSSRVNAMNHMQPKYKAELFKKAGMDEKMSCNLAMIGF